MSPDPRNQRLFITAKRDTPLDDLLRTNLADPESAENLVACGAVWLDRNRIMDPEFPVRRGCTVRVFLRPGQTEPFVLEPDAVVFRDSRVLVVAKPAGVPVQADPTSLFHNLARGVADYLRKDGEIFAPTPVSRLDVPVSGLVLFAVSKKWERELFRLMRERRIHKMYCAVLSGDGPGRILVDAPLGWRDGRAACDPAGKPSRTLFLRRGDWQGLPRYTVIPFTGRRHQIRAHAAGRLSPVAGDTRYGALRRPDIRGIALACAGYNFTLAQTRYRIRLSSDRLVSMLEPFASSLLEGDQ